MGEYATRNSDGMEIKIGTCENMYYLRYSDRDKVSALPGNIDPMDESILSEIRWRLPFPDEDNIQPGEYEPFRGVTLFDYSSPENIQNVGMVRTRTKYGMLIDVPCYHSEKLPENAGGVRFGWNGKSPAYELRFLKFIDGEPWGVYGCIECREEWRAPLKELIPFIGGCDRDICIRLIEWYAPDLPLYLKAIGKN